MSILKLNRILFSSSLDCLAPRPPPLPIHVIMPLRLTSPCLFLLRLYLMIYA